MANSGLSPEMAQAIDNYVTYHGSGCDDPKGTNVCDHGVPLDEECEGCAEETDDEPDMGDEADEN